MGKQPKIPDPGAASAAGIQADLNLQPFNYLMNAAATLGENTQVGGQQVNFSGLGAADVAGKVSDQMAATLLALQTEKSPQIIAQHIAELKAADPQGYAARQQLFDRIMADAQNNPDRPVATDLQNAIQNELAKGAGFDDARQEAQVRDATRGTQVSGGLYRGNAATAQEASNVVQAGESLRNTREQNALNLLQSGASPEDVAYRRFQQSLANLGAFQSGETPQAQFQQVSGAARGPVGVPNGTPNISFNPNAAGQGAQNALGIYSGQWSYMNGQANPWLAGLSTVGSTYGTLNNLGAFGGGGYYPQGMIAPSGAINSGYY